MKVTLSVELSLWEYIKYKCSSKFKDKVDKKLKNTTVITTVID